ncbi:ubiquitin-conjugating enzyme/RWD-like protein [Bisporella sp. PMI_857]|nr:ubiquitin-conjugating enzyme/RWD-like protein [Bisporella sp. PMI_857]
MSANNRIRRITKELSDIRQDKETQIHAELQDEKDVSHLLASFPGPPETPYEGGEYIVDVVLPNDYPFKPPIMKFVTKIWHPNVSSQTGAICLDTLSSAWSPVLTIKSALLSLQSLLNSPEPSDPQDAQVASQLMNNPDLFEATAREWAVKHASAPQHTAWTKRGPKKATPAKPKPQADNAARYQGYNKDLIDRFVSMGFDLDRVVDAFIFVNIDRNNGQDYELEEEYMGDITARLLGEP